MKLNEKHTILNILKFLFFATIVILSFGYTKMSFKDYLIPENIRELYIIFSIIIAFFIGNLFIRIPIKNKVLVFVIAILMLLIVMKFEIVFISMSLCIICMYISFSFSINYFIDFFTKKTRLSYIILSLLNFFILISICAVLSIDTLV
ncbi:hypothetical protein [Clostridium baratii]|uniref:hypothetical protein n=1 Tax=Clostridium baratii TaxID=1561 RepID=UPI0005F28128|nr:hypothetical protein [Clostridium baratii]AQM58594.1 hypothetical protein NPD11_3032 [Clostridium baratii]KJU71548.1 hypothetical protein UC77_09040 [Clostridium baratii]